MGTGDPGNHFQRERGDATRRQSVDQGAILERLQQADENRTAFQLRHLVGLASDLGAGANRLADLHHDVGGGTGFGSGGGQTGTGLDIGCVGHRRAGAGAFLDDHVKSHGDEFFDRFRRRRNAQLTGPIFFRNRDLHGL